MPSVSWQHIRLHCKKDLENLRAYHREHPNFEKEEKRLKELIAICKYHYLRDFR
jgi:hypothetical protein